MDTVKWLGESMAQLNTQDYSLENHKYKLFTCPIPAEQIILFSTENKYPCPPLLSCQWN